MTNVSVAAHGGGEGAAAGAAWGRVLAWSAAEARHHCAARGAAAAPRLVPTMVGY